MANEAEWPDWWSWDLDLDNPHLLDRMNQRGFDEIDLRLMLQHATGYRQDIVEGRWIIQTNHDGHPWEIIVEPEWVEILVVVTAYAVSR